MLGKEGVSSTCQCGKAKESQMPYNPALARPRDDDRQGDGQTRTGGAAAAGDVPVVEDATGESGGGGGGC
jgi:hypothetical protein